MLKIEDNKTIDTISYVDLRSTFQLKNQKSFEFYLEKIYEDFCTYKNEENIGMSKLRFIEWMKLPIIISEKLFYSFDLDKDGYLSLDDVRKPLSQLYFGTFEETSRVIFNLYDFDRDGFVTKEDIKLILSFVPLKSDKTKMEYKYQIESLQELDEILTSTFEKKTLNFKDFKDAIIKHSDIFLQILCFLYQRSPFQEKVIKKAESLSISKELDLWINKKVKSIDEFYPNFKSNDLTNIMKSQNKIESCPNIFLNSPKTNTRFSPLADFYITNQVGREKSLSFNNNLINNEVIPTQKTKFNSFTESSSIEIQGLKGMLRLSNDNNTNQIPDQKHSMPSTKKIRRLSSFTPTESHHNDPDIRKLENFKLESNNSSDEEYDENDGDMGENEIIVYPEYDGLNLFTLEFATEPQKQTTSNNQFNKDITKLEEEKKGEKQGSPCVSLEKKIDSADFEGYILKLDKDKKFSSIWLVLVDQNIYYYTDQTKTQLIGFHHLNGCFIKEVGRVEKKNEMYYSFLIIFSNKTQYYYSKDKETVKVWTSKLRSNIGYQSFFEFYEIIDDIGEGNFSQVKLGVNTITKEKVAIKIISKKKQSDKVLELIKREIEILKLNKHPNIITFIDHFENSEFIFIVLEYAIHGSLTDYVKENRKDLIEEDFAEIIYQVAKGLKYLHDFCIIHRDIKPDNIMVCSITNITIMDIKIEKQVESEFEYSDQMCKKAIEKN